MTKLSSFSFFFIASILIEWKIVKEHKEDKSAAPSGTPMQAKGKGLFGFRKRITPTGNSNLLPRNPTPDQNRDVEKADH